MHDEYAMVAWVLAAVFNATDSPGLDLAAYSYWAFTDVFTEQGLPAHNISFSGNWGLLNIFGVRKPVFRAFQLLANAGTTRVRGVASWDPTANRTMLDLRALSLHWNPNSSSSAPPTDVGVMCESSVMNGRGMFCNLFFPSTGFAVHPFPGHACAFV